MRGPVRSIKSRKRRGTQQEDDMGIHGDFGRALLREAMKDASPKVRDLFRRENIGVTRSGKQYAVEFVESLNGKREVIWVKAETVSEAKWKAANILMDREDRIE